MFNYCPSCASKKISFENGKVFRCPDCGFVYYHNIAAATGCIISVPSDGGGASGGCDDRLLFVVRGKEPGKGLLDLPGGFVDAGEGVFKGIYREIREEIGWAPPIPAGKTLTDVFKIFASFSNVYEYKGVKYNTCDMYFTVTAPGLTPDDLRLEKAEIAEVRFLRPQEIDFDQFAFESARQAVKTYLDKLY